MVKIFSLFSYVIFVLSVVFSVVFHFKYHRQVLKLNKLIVKVAYKRFSLIIPIIGLLILFVDIQSVIRRIHNSTSEQFYVIPVYLLQEDHDIMVVTDEIYP